VQKVREAAIRSQCQNNLKQLGIGFHNYHAANGTFPPHGFDFPTNPNPSNPYGNQLQGHSCFTLILSYLEQDNVIFAGNMNRSVVDPANLPAPAGTSNSGTVQIKIFMCPAVPGNPRTADYGPFLSQPANVIPGLGVIDYGATLGTGQATYKTTTGALQFNAGTRIPTITDGTSNTILLAEDGGRIDKWVNGVKSGTTAKGSGGAWADYNTNFIVDGTTCMVNCTNDGEIYSFHSGGAFVLLCDGSVQFLRTNVTQAVVAGLISRTGGETFQSPF